MAQDFLAIPGSSTASENHFSSAQHIGTDFQNCFSLKMFKAMQVPKGGYKDGMTSAHLEVSALAKGLDFPIEEAMHDGDEIVSTL